MWQKQALQRSIYAELQEKLSGRDGVIVVLREQAANSIIICLVASDYVAKQERRGFHWTK